MKNVTSDKYISFALSLLSSIAILVFKDDTTETGRIIIYCILGAVILGYLVYFAVQFFRRKRTLGSASIINNAKKYVKQMTALARANARQLKKFDFLSSQKKLDKRNKIGLGYGRFRRLYV